MANDYLKKEPSKTEKLIYELYMQQQQMDRALYTNSALLMALAIETKISPEALAEFLVNGNEKIKEYSGKVNKKIEELEKEQQKQHPHGHDHSHEGHDHNHEAPKEEAK